MPRHWLPGSQGATSLRARIAGFGSEGTRTTALGGWASACQACPHGAGTVFCGKLVAGVVGASEVRRLSRTSRFSLAAFGMSRRRRGLDKKRAERACSPLLDAPPAGALRRLRADRCRTRRRAEQVGPLRAVVAHHGDPRAAFAAAGSAGVCLIAAPDARQRAEAPGRMLFAGWRRPATLQGYRKGRVSHRGGRERGNPSCGVVRSVRARRAQTQASAARRVLLAGAAGGLGAVEFERRWR